MYKGEETVLDLLSKRKELTVAALAKETGLNEDSIRRIVESLKSSGYATTDIGEEHRASPTDELQGYCDKGFPEYSVFKKALSGASISDLAPAEKSIGIRWAKVKGFIDIDNGKLVPLKEEEDIRPVLDRMRSACEQLRDTGKTEFKVVEEEFYERRLLKKETIRTIRVVYTGKAIKLEQGFNVNIPAANAPIGKSHPITKMTDRIKRIMVELGFQEMDGSIIESSFWNFDALFQPQDHPARELADTFYLHGSIPLPKNKKLVERVKKAHEDGWGYKWSPEEASKAVLRTHTTCLSARNLQGQEAQEILRYRQGVQERGDRFQSPGGVPPGRGYHSMGERQLHRSTGHTQGILQEARFRQDKVQAQLLPIHRAFT
jgi:phenylalanyl-tRNA synthetase alpha chain